MLSGRGGVSVQPTNIESCSALRWDLNYNPHLCVRPRPSTVRPNGLDSSLRSLQDRTGMGTVSQLSTHAIPDFAVLVHPSR